MAEAKICYSGGSKQDLPHGTYILKWMPGDKAIWLRDKGEYGDWSSQLEAYVEGEVEPPPPPPPPEPEPEPEQPPVVTPPIITPDPDAIVVDPGQSVIEAIKRVKEGGQVQMRGRRDELLVYQGEAQGKPFVLTSAPGQVASLDGFIIEAGGGFTSHGFDVERLSNEPYPLVYAGFGTQGLVFNGVRAGALSVANPRAWTQEEWLARSRDGFNLFGGGHAVLGCHLHAVRGGVWLNSPGGSLAQNVTINHFAGDGLRVWAGSTAEDVTISDCYRIDGNHNDGIQIGDAGTPRSDNIKLRRVTVREWTDPATILHPLHFPLQGLGGFDGVYGNLEVTDCRIEVSAEVHGIAIYGAEDALIARNTVIAARNGTGIVPANAAQIWVTPSKRGEPCRNVTVRDNEAAHGIFLRGEGIIDGGGNVPAPQRG